MGLHIDSYYILPSTKFLCGSILSASLDMAPGYSGPLPCDLSSSPNHILADEATTLVSIVVSRNRIYRFKTITTKTLYYSVFVIATYKK